MTVCNAFNEQMLVAWNSSLVARDSIVENKWIVNSDTVLSEDLGNYAFDSSGVYQVQLIVTTANLCRDTMEKQMEILPSPKAAISINDSAQCFNQNSFHFSLNDSVQCFNEQLLVARNSSLVVGDSITEVSMVIGYSISQSISQVRQFSLSFNPEHQN
jgi:PKD repeat protein